MRFQISARHTDFGLFKTTHHPQQQCHLPATGAFIRAIAEPETHKQNTDFPRTFPAWLELKVNTFRALQKNGFQSVYKLYTIVYVSCRFVGHYSETSQPWEHVQCQQDCHLPVICPKQTGPQRYCTHKTQQTSQIGQKCAAHLLATHGKNTHTN